VSNNGSDDDDAADADQRRKRQREANLQAQRRCRERHRMHVTNLEAELDALRAKAKTDAAESARLQSSLQRSLVGLEECQRRWQVMEKEKVDMRQMKEYAEAKLSQTLEALRECTSKNVAASSAGRASPGAESRGAAGGSSPPPQTRTAPRARCFGMTSATRWAAWTSRSPRWRSRLSRSRLARRAMS
jgi:chromosome segregation ATPase